MNVRPSVLCPIDFLDASAGALRYAAAIAAHFATRLVVLTVEDPLLTEAADLGTGIVWSREDCKKEIEQFAARVFGPESPTLLRHSSTKWRSGKPAAEILRVARERSCGLIVDQLAWLDRHPEAVLRLDDRARAPRRRRARCWSRRRSIRGEVRLEDAKRLIRRILVPVDLSAASIEQTQIARGLAEALGVPLILVNVVEPLKSRLAARLHLAGVEADRRAVAEGRPRRPHGHASPPASPGGARRLRRSRGGACQGGAGSAPPA